jgi:hypothetical protein
MSKIETLRQALLELLREHERDGTLPTNARFLFYELVARGIVSKERTGSRRPDQDMNDALTDLRESGQIPWDWIVDETRSLEDYSGYSSVEAGMLEQLQRVCLDPWRGQTVLVLTESRSLAGVLRETAFHYRVHIAPTNGLCGGFLHTTIAPLLERAVMSENDLPQVLYLGDYDLSGNQIEENTRGVLEDELGGMPFRKNWQRVALTRTQVEQYNLPIIIKHDRRYKDGRPHEAVETEALNQRLIIELLETKLASLLPEPLEHVQEREQDQRRALRNKIENEGENDS